MVGFDSSQSTPEHELNPHKYLHGLEREHRAHNQSIEKKFGLIQIIFSVAAFATVLVNALLADSGAAHIPEAPLYGILGLLVPAVLVGTTMLKHEQLIQ